MEIQQFEVSSAQGEKFLVVGVPTGTPLRVEFAPDTTSIVGNVVWIVYLAAREVFRPRWKFGVFRRGVGRLRRDQLLVREVLPRDADADVTFAALVERVRQGEFDATDRHRDIKGPPATAEK
jgi:hypothetical protein